MGDDNESRIKKRALKKKPKVTDEEDKFSLPTTEADISTVDEKKPKKNRWQVLFSKYIEPLYTSENDILEDESLKPKKTRIEQCQWFFFLFSLALCSIYQNVKKFLFEKNKESNRSRIGVLFTRISISKQSLYDNKVFVIFALLLFTSLFVYLYYNSYIVNEKYYKEKKEDLWSEEIVPLKSNTQMNVACNEGTYNLEKKCMESCHTIKSSSMSISQINGDSCYQFVEILKDNDTIYEKHMDGQMVDLFAIFQHHIIYTMNNHEKNCKPIGYFSIKQKIHSPKMWYILESNGGTVIKLFYVDVVDEDDIMNIEGPSFIDLILFTHFMLNFNEKSSLFCSNTMLSSAAGWNNNGKLVGRPFLRSLRIDDQRGSMLDNARLFFNTYSMVRKKVIDMAFQIGSIRILDALSPYKECKSLFSLDDGPFGYPNTSLWDSLIYYYESKGANEENSIWNPFFAMNDPRFISDILDKCGDKSNIKDQSNVIEENFKKYTSAASNIGNFLWDIGSDLLSSRVLGNPWKYRYVERTEYICDFTIIRNLLITQYSLESSVHQIHDDKVVNVIPSIKLMLTEPYDPQNVGSLVRLHDRFFENLKTSIQEEWNKYDNNKNESCCICGFHLSLPYNIIIMNSKPKSTTLDLLLKPRIIQREMSPRDWTKLYTFENIHIPFTQFWKNLDKTLSEKSNHNLDFLHLRNAAAYHEVFSDWTRTHLPPEKKTDQSELIDNSDGAMVSIVEYYEKSPDTSNYKQRIRIYDSYFNMQCIDYCTHSWGKLAEKSYLAYHDDFMNLNKDGNNLEKYKCDMEVSNTKDQRPISEKTCMKMLKIVANEE